MTPFEIAANARRWDMAKELLEQLRADVTREDGRWGLHGHSAVDDDYFCALYYVIDKLAAIDKMES